jgi:hypothetical protein
MISRRLLLRWLPALGGLLLIPAAGEPLTAREGALPRIVRVMRCPSRSAAVVGAAYLQLVPAEAARDVLEQRICSALSESAGLGLHMTDTELEQVFRRQIQADFAADNVVSIRGWILSRTEARFYAFIALA